MSGDVLGRLNAIFDENPRLRVLAVAGVVLLLVLIFYTRLQGGGGEEETATPPPATTAPGPATTTPAPDPGTRGTKAQRREKLILQPGSGLPAKVARAYHRGKAIVLLVTQPSGIEDRLVRRGARLLERRRKRVAVFRVDVEHISAYSRITRGVDVSRVPALIVVPPP